MTINGEDCSDIQVIADSFNYFFSTIGERNERHIGKHNGSHFHDYLTNHTDCRFALQLINNNVTFVLLKRLNFRKAKGMMESLLNF